MQRLKQELILGLQLLEAIIQLAQQQVGLRAGPSISQWQRLGVWGLIDGRIKALDAEGVLQLRGLTQALQRATQLLGLLGFSQRRQALVLALLLKALTLLGKAAQSPGRSQQRMAIAQVVLHLPFDHRHRIGAEGMTAVRIKPLQRLQQPKTAELDKIIKINRTAQ